MLRVRACLLRTVPAVMLTQQEAGTEPRRVRRSKCRSVDKVLVPLRGSVRELLITICKSGEYHRMDVLVIGAWLPNSPAGIVVTVWVPRALKYVPGMASVPSEVCTWFGLAG